ncbi:hypothetical protein ACIPJN_38755 [Streptomyces sp. NPDC086796]|uniref:hypothetical protein n=1 Tax=unclassified Streptomyces TaxID=2593676 RepID=UPI00382A581C
MCSGWHGPPGAVIRSSGLSPYPDDLVQAQRDWLATYRQLAEPRPRHTTVLRRRLLDLSAQVQWHPFWSTPPGTPAARVELRRLAHHQEQRGTRAA